MQVVLTFYRNFSWIVLGISLFGCVIVLAYGSWQYMVVVFWTKVLTNTLLGLYINYYRSEQFCFFANLGYSKIRIFTFTFILDMLIWFLLSWLTIKLLL